MIKFLIFLGKVPARALSRFSERVVADAEFAQRSTEVMVGVAVLFFIATIVMLVLD